MMTNGNHGAGVARSGPTAASAARSGCRNCSPVMACPSSEPGLSQAPRNVDLHRLEQRYDVLRGYHECDVGLLEGRALHAVGSESHVGSVGSVVRKVDLDQLDGL